MGEVEEESHGWQLVVSTVPSQRLEGAEKEQDWEHGCSAQTSSHLRQRPKRQDYAGLLVGMKVHSLASEGSCCTAEKMAEAHIDCCTCVVVVETDSP